VEEEEEEEEEEELEGMRSSILVTQERLGLNNSIPFFEPTYPITNATSLSKSSLISTPNLPPLTSHESEDTEYGSPYKQNV